jgi:hypothetical protein
MKKQNLLNNSRLLIVITIALSFIPAVFLFHKIMTGDIPLWYDPARDLLSGLANLQKPTLIGPTSGIPGVFYGPYWIWLLSFGQLFSHDPRIVTFITATLPYFILFPLLLFRFSKVISVFTLCLLWLIFLIGFNKYFTDLWNPNPAPLFVLLAIYLQFLRTNVFTFKNILITFFAGFATGLVMNFHLSFGIGMMFGLLIFMFGESVFAFINAKKKIQTILTKLLFFILFGFGTVISFAPFLLFEVRHQFLQTQTLINALTHYGAVVGQTGLTKLLVLQLFFDRIGSVFFLPFFASVTLLVVCFTIYIINYQKRKEAKKSHELRLLLIVGSIILGILYIYLTAKNPIWVYHFIGVEVLFLLALGLLIDKIKIIKIIVGIWVILIFINFMFTLIKSKQHDPKSLYGNLAAEEVIVKKIHAESSQHDYTVFAYSPSIYIYEYSYLFKWLYNKEVPFTPESNPKNAKTVFLILPPELEKSKEEDFINFRTPGGSYKTTNQWKQQDGALIIKRTFYEKEQSN